MAERTWTCTRQTAGKRCRHENPRRRHYCEKCGKKRPASVGRSDRTGYRHQEPLDVLIARLGDRCAICGRRGPFGASAAPLQRDHDHGHPDKPTRGLLCPYDNRRLKAWMTADWLEAAAAYLRDPPAQRRERAEETAAPP
jgi:hypothetical protein